MDTRPQNSGGPEDQENRRKPKTWKSKFLGAMDGLGISILTVPAAFWIGTQQRAEFGYLLAAAIVGFLLAILCFRRWVGRQLKKIEAAEKRLRRRASQIQYRQLGLQLHTHFSTRVSAREQLEKWLELIDKKNRIIFGIGRWVSGMGCVVGAIAILVSNHGERSLGGSMLLCTGGLLLGARTVIEYFKGPKGPPD